MKTLSIIIPFHKNEKMLKACIRCLFESVTNSEKLEVIIVANNANLSKLDLNLKNKDLKVIRINKNLFYPAAIQRGAEISLGDFLVFMDPDVFVETGWLEAMLKTYKTHDNVGCVGATLLNPLNNRILDYGIGYQGYHTLHPYRGLLEKTPLCACDMSVQSVCSALFLISHKLYDELNGLDRALPYAFCDNDLCLRIIEKGYNIYVAANARAYHKGGTDYDNSKYSYSYLREECVAAFFYKNKSKYYNDYAKYLKNSFELNIHHVQHEKYLFINLSSVFDWTDYMLIIKQIGMQIVSTYEFPVPAKDLCRINLFNLLDHDLIDSKIPLLYFVDEISACFDNSLWFSFRDVHRDIFIDRNANIIPALNIANYFS